MKAAIGAVRMRMKDAVEAREVDRIAVADDQAVNQSMPGRLYRVSTKWATRRASRTSPSRRHSRYWSSSSVRSSRTRSHEAASSDGWVAWGAMPGPPTALTRHGLLSFLGQVLCSPVHLQQYVQLGRDSGQFRDQGIAQLPRSAPLLRTPSDRLTRMPMSNEPTIAVTNGPTGLRPA